MNPTGLLERCVIKKGFLASNTNHNNYRRIWTRDSSICGLAALQTTNTKLLNATKNSLKTILKHQHKTGFLPSNVGENSVSYGGNAGRVDANLWFLITYATYYIKTKQKIPKKEILQINKILQVLFSWEFNGKHLLYVPMGGDWADEYVQHGYILYDQLLYYQALKSLNKIGLFSDLQKIRDVKKTIRHTFFPDTQSPYIYNNAIPIKDKLLTSFYPGSIQTRFDGFAYCLSVLLDVFPKHIRKKIILDAKKFEIKSLIPAFAPVIKPTDIEFMQLQTNVGFEFKNKPYEYHNGGIWPLLNGFYVLAKRQMQEQTYTNTLYSLQKLNATDSYSYNEWFNAQTFLPKGIYHQAWSAAAQILAEKQKKVFL